MQKRRNISFGGAGNNNYIEPRPSIIDLENSVGAPNRISRPTINNTYDGTQHKVNTQNVTPSNKFNMNAICSNESAFSNRNSRDYQGAQAANGSLNGRSMKKNPDLMAQKYNNSDPQGSHKYHPNYIEELLLNS